MKKMRSLFENKKQQYIAQSMANGLTTAAMNDHSARQYHEPAQIVQKLATIDPTPNGAALQWLARLYTKGMFKMEDAQRVRTDLEKFFKFRAKIQNKDLNSYKTMEELYDVIEQFDDEEQVVSGKEQKRQAKLEGADYVINTPNFKVIHLKTGDAAQFYASNTKWCTSNCSTFESYARQGKIYVIIAKDPTSGKTRKFQMHYESSQVMDERDVSIQNNKADINLLSSYPEWYEFLNMLVDTHYKLQID